MILIVVIWQAEYYVQYKASKKTVNSNDSTKIDQRMNRLDSLYEIKNIPLLKEELIQFRKDEAEWSKSVSDLKLAKIYDWLYFKHDDLEDVRNARLYAKKALNLIDSTKQKYFYADMLRNYALSESQLENYNKAINIHFRALDFLGSDTLNTSYSYITQNLGNNYREIGELDLALKYYDKSEAVVKAVRKIDMIDNFDEILGYIYANIGYVYTLQNKLEAANEKYLESIKYFVEYDLTFHENIVKSVLASNYIEQQKIQEAEQQLKGILKFASTNQDFELFVETSISLFKLNIKKGKTERAFKILSRAENNIGTSNSNRLLLKILDTKLTYFKNKNEYQKAFSLLESKVKLQDSVYAATKRDLQRELNVKYQTNLKNEQINNLELVNAKEKRINQFYLFGLIFLLIVLITIFLLLRRISNQKKQVDQANFTKDQLFSIIAHDLRSPILALHGMGDLIQYHIKNNNHDKLKQLGNESQITLSKINQLLKNLLDWSLANKNQLNFKPEKLNTLKLIDDNIHLFDNLLQTKQVEVVIDIQERFLCLDKNMMGSAIRNILSNAIKLSPEHSRLIITGKTIESSYWLSIEDEAGGIPDEILKLIQQNKQELVTGKSNQSVGLGLRLIQLFVDKNKAKLHIENTPKGTKMSIEFPEQTIKS